MKKVTLKITGGRGDKIAQFYDCGKLGDERYERAQSRNSSTSTTSSFPDAKAASPAN